MKWQWCNLLTRFLIIGVYWTQTPSGCQNHPTVVVNHVYRSLPHTPLISGACSHHPDHRRRSYGGEVGGHIHDERDELRDLQISDKVKQQQQQQQQQRFKFSTLLNSKSSENFNHLRRIAISTVTNEINQIKRQNRVTEHSYRINVLYSMKRMANIQLSGSTT